VSEIVQRYERNVRGRDFVVGDIHGCFDQLRAALDTAGFLPESDRLFSVGDLIDRGPQSTETLQWLAKPWFHACIGNHDDMALKDRNSNRVCPGSEVLELRIRGRSGVIRAKNRWVGIGKRLSEGP
jgi:hypothetical protein